MQAIIALMKVIYKVLGLKFDEVPVFFEDGKKVSAYGVDRKNNQKYIIVPNDPNVTIYMLLNVAYTSYVAYADSLGMKLQHVIESDEVKTAKIRFNEASERDATSFSFVFVDVICEGLLKKNNSDFLLKAHSDFSKPYDVVNSGLDKVDELSIQNDLNESYKIIREKYHDLLTNELNFIIDNMSVNF